MLCHTARDDVTRGGAGYIAMVSRVTVIVHKKGMTQTEDAKVKKTRIWHQQFDGSVQDFLYTKYLFSFFFFFPPLEIRELS